MMNNNLLHVLNVSGPNAHVPRNKMDYDGPTHNSQAVSSNDYSLN